MARFRGTVQGGRGEASRLGHRSIKTSTDGWSLGVTVKSSMRTDDENGDSFTIHATGGSNDSGRSHRIARVEETPNGDGSHTRRIILFDADGQVVEVYTI